MTEDLIFTQQHASFGSFGSDGLVYSTGSDDFHVRTMLISFLRSLCNEV